MAAFSLGLTAISSASLPTVSTTNRRTPLRIAASLLPPNPGGSTPRTTHLINIAGTIFRGISSAFPKQRVSIDQCQPQTDTQHNNASTIASSKPDRVQELRVFEFNEGDRNSPAYLKLSPKAEKSLGDLVPFTNKTYTGDLNKRIGMTAGIIIYIRDDPIKGDVYEAAYSFYFGNYGHISLQGPYYSKVDTFLTVTGGTGVFEGVYGKARLHNVVYPLKLYYTFSLKGIPDLPKELVGFDPVDPKPDVVPSQAAKSLLSGATIDCFTD